jgi:hypothetical protein
MKDARKDLMDRGLKANYFNVQTLAVEWWEKEQELKQKELKQ